MKNTFLYLAILVILGVAAYFIVNNNSEASTISGADSDFAIKNIEKIHKVFIADKQGRTATLEKKNNVWKYINSKGQEYDIRPSALEFFLETVEKVDVRYLVPDAAMELAVNNLATNGRKVEFYDKNGKRFKTYYVGGASNDQQGTFMVMENSNQPYVTHLNFMDGFLTDRYILEEKDWRDKTVFGYKSEDIKSIQIDYPLQQSNSFLLKKVSSEKFEVEPLYPSTKRIPTEVLHQKALSYLYNYERLIAEAFENENRNRNELLEKIPFATVQIITKDDVIKTVKFIPVVEQIEVDEETEAATRPAVQRYFAFANGNEDVYLVQGLLFNKIFWGYDFFFKD